MVASLSYHLPIQLHFLHIVGIGLQLSMELFHLLLDSSSASQNLESRSMIVAVKKDLSQMPVRLIGLLVWLC